MSSNKLLQLFDFTLTFCPTFLLPLFLAGRQQCCTILSLNLLKKSFELLSHVGLGLVLITMTFCTEKRETTCPGICDSSPISCYDFILLHTYSLTRCDTVAALCNCFLLVLATPLFPWSKVGFSILLKGTSMENVKGAERLSHSISPYRFAQLVWDRQRRPWHNKLTVEPCGHCTTVPRLQLLGSKEGHF